MIEIDHTVVNNPDPPPPEPAKPILASQLLELERKQRKRFTGQGRDERISTGCGEINEILGGGCERGIVVGISAEGGEGRLISLHLLSSILISHLISPSPPTPRVTIIDTTGSFPVSLLAQVLKSRIISSRATSATAAVRSANYPVLGKEQRENEADIEGEVQRCLEMVAISRVFDIEGLWEVLGEVGRNGTLEDEVKNILENISEAHARTGNQSSQKPPEIIDSEEELTPEEAPPPRHQKESSGVELIVIDNMTHIISELLSRREKSEAHTLLNLLSITLHTLTQTSNILTLIHNTTVPSKASSTPAHPTTASTSTSSRPRQPQIQTPSSIFPSNTTKPALGKIFTQFPALHLFISKLAKGRGDAELLYGGGGQDEDSVSGQQGAVNYCYVVEVLKDETPNLGPENEKKKGKKFGWREQRWTAVETTADGTGFVGAFQVKGDMGGMGLGRETIGGLRGVGNVAKIYGFGGRKV